MKNIVNIGIFKYNKSCNIGDYIQSLVQIQLLSMFYNEMWTIEDDVIRDLFVYFSKFHINNGTHESINSDVHIHIIDRDSLSSTRIDKLYVIMNGWFLHKNNYTYDFPPPDNVIPIYLSFHIAARDILTNDTISHLKKYEPIGCRDLFTRDMLMQYGINSFFTGCLTMCLQNTESKIRSGIFNVSSTSGFVSNNITRVDPTDNRILDNYILGFELAFNYFLMYCSAEMVITDRLHSYIPSMSLGVKNVVFNKRRMPMKNRLSGLEDLVKSSSRDHYSNAFRTYVKNIIKHILLNDKTKMKNELELLRLNAIGVKSIDNNTDNSNNNIAITFDNNYVDIVSTVLYSLSVSNPNSNFIVHCLTRDVVDFCKLKSKISILKNIELIEYKITDKFDKYQTTLGHVSVSALDRLLIPKLLPASINRVVYMDLDILVLGDISKLFTIETGPLGICARNSKKLGVVSRGTLVNVWMKYNTNYDDSIKYDYKDSFNAGIIVFDLDKLRLNNFDSFASKLVNKYGFNDQIILNLYCKNTNTILPSKYNAWDDIKNPVILHFAGSKKPYGTKPNKYTELWNRFKIPFKENN